MGRAMMHAAKRGQCFRVVVAAFSAGFDVVQIQVLTVPTARDAALSAIALEHLPAYCGWDGLGDPRGFGSVALTLTYLAP